MDTAFKPRKELFRPCCGHCDWARKRKTTNEIGMRVIHYYCPFLDEEHAYGHTCDTTGTDDGTQISIFDKNYKEDPFYELH